jgi:hypothetical protein
MTLETIKEALDRLEEGQDKLMKLITGNGGVGLTETVRNVDNRLDGHLAKHQGRRSFWAEKVVYLGVTLAAVALTAWLN